ncbi:hypothetical protein RI056_10435 [Komagataeibacter nataicola]|uniref:hypothetical protein n=2 Tax=Komagataeibacter nataicola TaxID=265960 RepID=UPI0028AF9B2B|nr:hypothetical protein [Komagataeibacter nataicola]WNM07527.1 hypothetical protein RI056_10435 [Komagataeibacter nataicola]
MKYDPIPAPQAEVLRDSSAAFRKEYRNWFISNIENRIRVLNNTLKTSDFPIKIDLDYSYESVKMLSEWLAKHVESVKLNEEEKEKIKNSQPFPIAIPESVISSVTKSLAFDVGIYLGEVLRKKNPWVIWKQVSTGKRNYFYGQMVLVGLGKVDICPMHIVEVFCVGVKEGEYTDGKRLLSLFNMWREKAQNNKPADDDV